MAPAVLVRRVLAVWLGLAGVASAAPALQPCRVDGIRNGVQCGTLTRPLDPARPDGTSIAIHYVVVPALARRKLPDPVFLLAGGPGQSAIALAPAVLPLLDRLNNRRDLVFVDQRGTGRSAPLTCPDTRRAPLAEQADADRQVAHLAACKAALQQKPWGDLRDYTTSIAMQDLDAVRRALGMDRINLLGASYGTRAALEYQRQFPDAVRRSVLDGVAPPDMALPAAFSTDGQAALDALFAACAGTPACAAAHPALHARWEALLAAMPKPVAVRHPVTGAVERFTLTRSMVLDAVRGALYVPALAAALPAAIDAAADDRYEGLFGLNTAYASRPETLPALGMHFSVVCAEDLPRMAASSDPPGADFGSAAGDLYRRVCADWPRGIPPAGFYDLPTSRAAVLLLSGGDDPATPPRHAERVARRLGPLARSIVVPHAGHGVMGLGCARDVIYRFIDAGDDRAALAVDASCLDGVPRPPAFEPITAAAADTR
ncbi:MAG: alpha/beta fold hydrolase [Proteobacteria bacterium]|nr:alpha/beta fold hydrolase [Pseudomonadota bacterium]